MRTYAAALVLLGLATWASAQNLQTTSPAPDIYFDPPRDASIGLQSPVYQTFLAEVGGQWTSQWNYATGTPKAIYGDGLPLTSWQGNSIEEARRQANWVLTHFHDLLGLGVSDFHEVIGERMGQTWSFTFEQHFRGLQVIDCRSDVRINMRGVLAEFGSVAWPIPANFNTAPVVDEGNATRIAWQTLNVEQPKFAQPALKANRLVIWGDVNAPKTTPFFLAWEVPVSAVNQEGNGPIGRYYVDALNGTVLHYTNDKHECSSHSEPAGHEPVGAGAAALPPTTVTVQGWAIDGLVGGGTPHNIPLPGVEINVPGVGVLVTDVNGQITPNISSPTMVTVNTNGVHCRLIVGPSAPSATVTLQPGVPQTIQLLTNAATSAQLAHTTTYLWIYKVNEFCRTILGNSNELNIANNVLPTVNISQTCNAFYQNNTVNFFAAGGGCNNTGFSTVVAHEWGHGLDDQYGGISQTQGLSEGWGDTVAMYLVDQPVVAPGFFTSGGGIRTGLNNTTYPPPQEVHDAGEVWMGFNWRFRDNLRTSLGTPQAVAISNTIVIGSIVANASDQPSAVREVFIADDDDGNLNNGTPHYNELSAAAIIKNLPFPVRQVGTITSPALANTQLQLTPRAVLATAVPLNGTFTQVRLHYNDGLPRSHVMVPTGNANEFQGLLPGELAPFTMTYHIEATHSTGAVVRFPLTTEATYQVTGPEITVFSEDFQGTAPGWTHGAIAGTDNWQLGIPTGAPNDPSPANSTRVYGNNLSGNYSDNSENWLRSPVINCTGQTGVKLRFRRWLSVESGQFDQASVRINGSQLWVNPATGDLLDTSWQTIELALPQATNNPAVTIEWHLRSDLSVHFGGWNIDDVQIVASGSLPPLDAELRILPEQAVVNAPLSLNLHTNGMQPFALAIGDSAGPTNFPGVPVIAVGGNYVSFGGLTNALGVFAMNFNAPASVGLNGAKWFSQVLTLNGGNLVTSNQFVNLFQQ